MRKFTTVLFTVFLLAFVATGSVTPNQALATNEGGPEIMSEEGVIFDDLIMEQSGGTNDGASGDPDAAGDGFGFMGDTFSGSFSDLIDRGIITIQEYVCLLMEQLIPAQ